MWLHWTVAEIGIRELRDNLSRQIRRVEAGERISITAHGRVVAELVPPGSGPAPQSKFDQLLAAGIIRPPVEPAGPIAWLSIQLPRGTAAELIDADRAED
jgi:prevent-host-death family protein